MLSFSIKHIKRFQRKREKENMMMAAFCYSKQKHEEFSNENSSCLWLQDDWNSIREKSLFSCNIYAFQTSRRSCFSWISEQLNLHYINCSILHTIIKMNIHIQHLNRASSGTWDSKEED